MEALKSSDAVILEDTVQETTVVIAEAVTEAENCIFCYDGSGDCPNCDSTGFMDDHHEEPCEDCGSTGVCPACDGNGTATAPI